MNWEKYWIYQFTLTSVPILATFVYGSEKNHPLQDRVRNLGNALGHLVATWRHYVGVDGLGRHTRF